MTLSTQSIPSVTNVPEVAFDAGLFRLIFQRMEGGIRLAALIDLQSGRQWLASESLPFFSLVLKNSLTGEQVEVDAVRGWSEVTIGESPDGFELVLRDPEAIAPESLEVCLRAALQENRSALAWTLRVVPKGKTWGVWSAQFPRLAMAEPGENGCLFLPRGPGEAAQNVWRREFDFHQMYPNGWCSMSFFAFYTQPAGGEAGRGLYMGFHDPRGSAKDYQLKSDPARGRLEFDCDYPAEGRDRAGNAFEMPGKLVWRFFDGDWYDASILYRDWVLKYGAWIPEGKEREDTPAWFRDSLVWFRLRGDAAFCVPAAKRFAREIGLSVGFHWYNWHLIPYDNDYPHYFPVKPGFIEGVRELQESGIRVMPYINGRLWDTRDRGIEDWQFTEQGLPGATKDENGQPFTETYYSIEEDGSPVCLAVMCPSTQVWREKLRELTARLFNECGVDGIYIDQIAAASPWICMDPTHPHPAGGGSWWNEAYRDLIDSIRASMPEDKILTTECNSEPFLSKFDGYLTWHWQYQDQVPAFSVIYGGRIQLFGRSYSRDAMRGQALRMKAGQQLVFGEQIGWVESAEILEEPESLKFLRRMGLLRRRFHRYFNAGRMFRPPVLLGDNPEVQADWQWLGPWMVTGKSVLASAWGIPEESRMVLLLVNVGDSQVTLQVDFTRTLVEMNPDREWTLLVCPPEGTEKRMPLLRDESTLLELGPHEAVAWELE